MNLRVISIFLLIILYATASPAKHRKSGLIHPNRAHGRIIGGSPAAAGEFPFAASITYRTTEGSYFCAGTLISNKWVVTAGHCVINAFQFTLHVGSIDRQGAEGETISTYDFVLNPDFSATPLMNDIGLIQMRFAITFTDYIKAVDLLPSAQADDTTTGIIIGWGTTSDQDASFSQRLNFVKVALISNTECAQTYGSQITDEKFCVVGEYNEGTCSGDSGGPLIQYAARGATVLVGVSSFISQNGCETPEPSGFTRVYSFADWITNTTGVPH